MTARAGVILDPGPFSNHLSTVRAIGGDERDVSHDVDGIENLLEYQQARKQVQFAEKFHQLKQWQEEQKEQLLQQQQQRMDLLRCQQEQLQRVLAEQRNKQWGGSTSFSSPSQGQSQSVRHHHPGSPLSRESSSPTERGPASLLQRYDSSSLGNLLQQAQSDILQAEEIGSDIENAGSVEEDGFYPLPDTASELSDGDGPRFEMDGDNSPLVEDFHNHHIPKLQEQSPSQNQMQSEQLPCSPSPASPPYRQGASSLRDGEAAGDLTGYKSKEADQSGERPKSKASSDDGDDDRPIESQFGYSAKSFEELLEEKLQLENASNQMQQQKGSKKPVHTFLKKGEGLARFGKMKMPSTRIKKKQKGSLEGQRSSTDSFVDRKQREIQHIHRQQSNGDERLSDPGDTNDVFRKPVGRAPVSILKERLPSRSSAASHNGVLSVPSKEGLEAEASQADKSFGLVQWEKKKVIEEEDLAEFEMLEQAAEDNVSFSSENSLVIGVMQRARLRGKMFNSSPLSKKGLPTLHSVDAADDGTEESHGKSGDQKMPPEESPEEEEEEEYGSDMNDTLTEETGIGRRQTATRKVTKGRSVNSNFGSKLERRFQSRTEFEEILQGEDGEAKSENEQHSLEESSESDDDDDDDDDSIDGLVTVIPNRLQNMLGHGRGSQDGEVEERPVVSREEITRKNQRSERESRGDQQMGSFVNIEEINKNNNRLGEASSGSRSEESDKEGGDGDERGREQSGGAGYEFEDDETWGDFSANLSDSSSDSIVVGGPSLTSTPPTKLNAKSKSVLEQESVERESADEHKDPIGSTPPPSHLVAKLFPQLKRKEKVNPDQNAALSALHAVRDRPIGEGLQAKVFKDKLSELENEIERFRKENAALSRLRDERERGLELFKKEVTEFERQKEAELKKIEEYRDKEMKKLRKEKKLFEKHQKATRSLPDKKDREEIDQLRNQLSELQQELSRRESRWSANTRRLKDRVEALLDENKNLTEEVETMRAKRQEDLAKGERKKAVARIRALREAGKPKSLIPEFEPGKFPALPSNVGTISEKSKTSNSQQKRTTTHKDGLKQSSKMKDDPDSSDSDISEINSPSPLRGNDHLPPSSPPAVRDQEALKSPQISPERDGGDTKEQQVHHPDGKVEVIHPDGSKVITFSNGTRKEISSDGQLITVTFFNGDTRQIFPDQRVVYYYAETQITHTTYSDGLEIIHFPNNQTEKHYPDGTKEITFPDQTIKYLFQNGGEECVFPDGTLLRVAPDGERTMEFPNGQREIHTAEYKKREYPDGTVKTIYPDGRQETRYSHGRIRVKDKDGRVLLDQQT